MRETVAKLFTALDIETVLRICIVVELGTDGCSHGEDGIDIGWRVAKFG